MLDKFAKKESPVLGYAGFGGGVSSLLTLASGEITYVDDVFSTILREGTGTSRTITNGIDLDGKGGLIWTKRRNTNGEHSLADSGRGKQGSDSYYLEFSSSNTYGSQSRAWGISSFNSNGYTLGGTDNQFNSTGSTYCDWVFRKCPGFFDIVTYTGSGSVQNISHNLGSVPGMIIVKKTSSSGVWGVYHRSLGNTKKITLNETTAAETYTDYWNSTTPTSTQFTVGTNTSVNANGETYVAYIFAHNDGSFGEDSDEAVIKCGSYSGNSSTTGPVIDLGFEPQWVMIKSATTIGDWGIVDAMRGQGVDSSSSQKLKADSGNTEGASNFIKLNATGFQLTTHVADINGSGNDYIYIAIRRPHKPPKVGTEAFYPELLTSQTQISTPGFAPDMVWQIWNRSYPSFYIGNRLTGNGKYVRTFSSDAEGSFASWEFDAPTGEFTQSLSTGSTSGGIQYFFKRAPKFFDAVCYTGNGITGRSVSHNLEVAPELLLVKQRSSGDSWAVYASSQGSSKETFLNGTIAFSTGNSIWTGTDPTATAFYVKNDGQVNQNGQTYIGLLFASLNGISKIGTYSGTGSAVNVDCGFTAGARLVIIKRTDDTGNWWCWDSARGIVSGNDPWVYLNATTAEASNADHIDPLNAGFTVNAGNSELNAYGGTYLFLAIA